MIFGMSTACFFPHAYTEQTIDIMSDMGIKNTEIFFSCMAEYQSSFITDLKKRLNDHDMNAYSVHALSMQFEPQLFSLHNRARQEAVDIFQRVLEAGARLGASVYVFHGPSNIKRAKKLSLDYHHIAETADFLSDMAKEYKIKLAWENVHWCWYAKPDFASKVLQLVNTDNLYFTLDMKQAAQSGFDPSDFIKNAGGKLINIHICDFERTDEHGIVPALPFHGLTDFFTFRESLQKSGYDHGMILEVYWNNFADYKQLSDNFNQVKSFFSDN